MNTKTELNSTKKLVLRVLEQYPETRNSDTKLYVQCAREIGARTLEDLENIPLNIVSVHKARQPIQNKLGLFVADKKVQKKRFERQLEFRDWMVDF
ncbi:MAG: hypothetical protein K0S80_5312 [Neobacillus sp.]|nr:hypothetical protein [Neobacillus sp.]